MPANTYIASILSITENGLKPVLVEPRIDTLELDDSQLETHLSDRTRAVLLVHLYGRCAMTQQVADFCHRRHLLLIEDNAQAHGCMYGGRRTGSFGDAAAHSFYPGKNFGALGDAGAITTDDASLADLCRALGNYGSSRKYVFPYKGRNSRMDEIQAAVLSVKLCYLDADNQRRKQIATYYAQHISNPAITLPGAEGWLRGDVDHVFHIFPVLCAYRNELQEYLQQKGIGTMIHYPIPPHQQDCYPEWHTLSLPITERIHREELSIPCAMWWMSSIASRNDIVCILLTSKYVLLLLQFLSDGVIAMIHRCIDRFADVPSHLLCYAVDERGNTVKVW